MRCGVVWRLILDLYRKKIGFSSSVSRYFTFYFKSNLLTFLQTNSHSHHLACQTNRERSYFWKQHQQEVSAGAGVGCEWKYFMKTFCEPRLVVQKLRVGESLIERFEENVKCFWNGECYCVIHRQYSIHCLSSLNQAQSVRQDGHLAARGFHLRPQISNLNIAGSKVCRKFTWFQTRWPEKCNKKWQRLNIFDRRKLQRMPS